MAIWLYGAAVGGLLALWMCGDLPKVPLQSRIDRFRTVNARDFFCGEIAQHGCNLVFPTQIGTLRRTDHLSQPIGGRERPRLTDLR